MDAIRGILDQQRQWKLMSPSSLIFANLPIVVCQFLNDRITNEFYSHGRKCIDQNCDAQRIRCPNGFRRVRLGRCGVECIQLGGSGQRPAETLTSRCFSLQEAFMHLWWQYNRCFFLRLEEALFDKEGFWGEGATMEVIGRVESACSTVLTLRKKVGRGCDGIIEAELTFEAQLL